MKNQVNETKNKITKNKKEIKNKNKNKHKIKNKNKIEKIENILKEKAHHGPKLSLK